MTENEISTKIIGLAIDVHRNLGPGLLENAYKECLYYKINQAGLFVEKEKAMPIIFEDVKLDCGYRFGAWRLVGIRSTNVQQTTNVDRSINVQFSTSAPILPNPC